MLRWWLVLAVLSGGSAVAEDKEILVLDEVPADGLELGVVSANSRNFSGRTDAAKENYVVRELKWQAARLEGDAIVVTTMHRRERPQPSYGRLPGQMQYRKITEFHGRATVLRLPEDFIWPLPETDDPEEP